MPTAEEYVHGDNKEEIQRGSPKIAQEAEELAKGPNEPQTVFQGKCHTERKGSSWGQLSFPMEDV